MSFNKYPYTDFHEANLDFILNKIGDIDKAVEASKGSVDAAKASEDAAKTSEDAAKASEENAQTSAESASASVQAAADIVADTNSQIALLQGRVDNIIPEGTQTEGNTELLDIRVGADGTIYDSAGNSVRKQYEYITKNLEGLSKLKIVKFASFSSDFEEVGVPQNSNIWVKAVGSDDTTVTGLVLYGYVGDSPERLGAVTIGNFLNVQTSKAYDKLRVAIEPSHFTSLNTYYGYSINSVPAELILQSVPVNKASSLYFGDRSEVLWITATNVDEILDNNLNNAPINTTMFLSFNKSVAENVVNFPAEALKHYGIYHTLITYRTYYNINTYVLNQILFSTASGIYSRRKELNTDWTSWTSFTSPGRKIVTIGTNGEYTSLTDGLAYAFNTGDCDVFINDGVYDLITEGTISRFAEGIPLGHNCKYYFSSNSKVICHYTGASASVMENFSCFKTGNGSSYGDHFELHNCTIEASKIRYCLHDEGGSESTSKAYTHIYEGCNFKIDNYENPIKQGEFYHCIGGGLGNSASIVIRDCHFNSLRKYSQATDPIVHADVSYHGNWASTASAQAGKSNIKITNTYFEHAFQASAPNTETQKKYLLFANNSFNSNETVNGIYYNLTSTAHWDIDAWNNYNRQ